MTPLSTFFTYNTVGKLVEVKDPEGIKTQYSYDLAGRRVQQIHPDKGISIALAVVINLIPSKIFWSLLRKDSIYTLFFFSLTVNLLYYLCFILLKTDDSLLSFLKGLINNFPTSIYYLVPSIIPSFYFILIGIIIYKQKIFIQFIFKSYVNRFGYFF
uniref:RHS repeat domain-containing protein n=1 Tax=Chryseobacterium flavum TaxID=415851 RepID=UPI0035E41BC1